MQQYRNLSGDSGVWAFSLNTMAIVVQFEGGSIYEYTYSSAGSHNIEMMKSLALRGKGLNSYINKNVKEKYARILRK